MLKDILKDSNSILSEFFRISILEDNVELEFLYGSNYMNKLLRKDFLKLSEHLKNNYFHLETINDLDIQINNKTADFINNRITVHGIDSIKEYCKTDTLSDDLSLDTPSDDTSCDTS